MIQDIFNRYTLISLMTIIAVDIPLYIVKYFPQHSVLFYFLGLFSYVIGAYFMFKEINFDNFPLPIALIRFFQLILPSEELIRVGLLFLIK